MPFEVHIILSVHSTILSPLFSASLFPGPTTNLSPPRIVPPWSPAAARGLHLRPGNSEIGPIRQESYR